MLGLLSPPSAPQSVIKVSTRSLGPPLGLIKVSIGSIFDHGDTLIMGFGPGSGVGDRDDRDAR